MILLPSRGRPQKLARFFEAYAHTGAVEPGIVMIEQRDVESYSGVQLPDGWRRVVVPESLISKKFNDAALKYAPGEPRYFVMADDCVPETPHWDALLAEKAGTKGVAWGDDVMRRPPPLGHPCIGGDLVRALGWIAAPGFGHFWWDNALRDIVDALGIGHYMPGVITRHLHFSVTGDTDVFERGKTGDDEIRYHAWREKSMAADIERARKKLRLGKVG